MRTMTLCVGLVGLLLIAGCQNTELLACQDESAVLVTQAADLQKKLDRQTESSNTMLTILMEKSIKSKKKIDELTQEKKTQREDFQQENKKQQAKLVSFNEKISTSARLLYEIRQHLEQLMRENSQLEERVAQLSASSVSDGDGN